MLKGTLLEICTKQDFELLDDRKPQIVTQFSVERPETGSRASRRPPKLQPAAQLTRLAGWFRRRRRSYLSVLWRM